MRLIDADALYAALMEKCTKIARGTGRNRLALSCKAVADMVKDAPTVDAVPVTSWVTDRHPAFGEDVLITFATGEIGIGDYRDFDDSPWYAGGWYFGDEDIVAWMPLPEPWKEESDATN